jgi:pimeloyl-ACP methyl ester carboxylesterase
MPELQWTPCILRGDYRRIRLRTPTLLLFGAADSALPPALANRVLQDHRTYADHVEVGFVADAAHFIADERPDAVVEHALEFISRSANGI